MKHRIRLHLYEAAAASLGVLGAVALAVVFFPQINPGAYGTMSRDRGPSASRYLVGVPCAGVLFWGAFAANARARCERKRMGAGAKSRGG